MAPVPTTRSDFLERIERINVWKKRGQRAPHKPLLLLLALGRFLNERERFAPYREIEEMLTKLLQRFGRPRETRPGTRPQPERPFGRLPADGLWEIASSEELSRTARGDLLVRELHKGGVEGGFPEPVYDLLRQRPGLAREAAQRLLDSHFPESLHQEIRDATGIPYSWEMRDSPARPRDRAFRVEVLREYEQRCAICDFDVRLGNELIGLEAAHIKWHAAGGPDEITNGLALCGLHHKAFDRGAVGLKAGDSGYRIVVSSDVNGRSYPVHWFLDFHDKPLRTPQNRRYDPEPEFVKWHQTEVFREPARP